MNDKSPQSAKPSVMFSLRANSPSGELLDLSALEEEDIEQISSPMNSLGNLREAERRVSEASATYMALNETFMRALHFPIVCENLEQGVTASSITRHLRVYPATTTKLLDRLEKGGHITRETRKAAYESVGAMQSRRFHAAARLDREERDIVIRFLVDMTEQIDMKHADWAQHSVVHCAQCGAAPRHTTT